MTLFRIADRIEHTACWHGTTLTWNEHTTLKIMGRHFGTHRSGGLKV